MCDTKWCQPASEAITHQYMGSQGIWGKHVVSDTGGSGVGHVLMRCYAEASQEEIVGGRGK